MKKMTRDGYTLIELIVVSALMVIILLMASLKAGLGTTVLNSEANGMLSAVRYTRQLNINGELSQRFKIISEDGALYYCIESERYPFKTYLKTKIDENIIVQKKIMADEDNNLAINLAEYTKINKDVNYIFFESHFTNNAANGDGTLIIEAIDSYMIYKITIVPTSGRIYMYKIKR